MVNNRMSIQLRGVRLARAGAVLATTLLLASPPASGSPQATPPPQERPFVDDAMSTGVPGGAAARFDGGRVVSTESFGGATSRTRFLWGSVSKPVAAAVAERLERDGTLDLDDSVARYLPGGPDVPVRALLNHTSGLPFGADRLDVDRPTASATATVAGLPTPATDSRGRYRYSSLGFVYLQAVIEQVTGGSYDGALRHTFPGTGIRASAAACADVTPPHRFVGPWALDVGGGYDGAGGAYGYTCGSLEDLVAFARDHLRRPDLPSGADTGHPGERYAQGWRLTQAPGEPVRQWHTGTVPGYFSAVYLDPASGDGAVVLMNASGFLHEERLAAVTRAADDRAEGRAVTPLPSTTATVAPAALGLTALVVAVAALLTRARRRRVVLLWAALVVAVTVGPIVALSTQGYPLRYLWLWEPGLAVGAVALAGAACLGLVRCATGSRVHLPDVDLNRL